MTTRAPALQTHYSVLKVSGDAPVEVIRAAYRSLSSKHHPDHNPQTPEAGKLMAAINAAYEVLTDPAKRREHDAWIEREESLIARRDAGSTPVPMATGIVPVKRASLTMARLRRKPYVVALTVALLLCVIVFAIAPIFGARDLWLEQAWQQTWRGERNAAQPLANTPPSPEMLSADTQPEPEFRRALNWETALKR